MYCKRPVANAGKDFVPTLATAASGLFSVSVNMFAPWPK